VRYSTHTADYSSRAAEEAYSTIHDALISTRSCQSQFRSSYVKHMVAAAPISTARQRLTEPDLAMQPPKASPIRMAFLVDSLRVPAFVGEVLQWAQISPCILATHLILLPSRNNTRSLIHEKVSRIFRCNYIYLYICIFLYRMISILERLLIGKNTEIARHLVYINLSSFKIPTVVLSTSGIPHFKLSRQDTQIVNELGADLIVDFSEGLQSSEILSSAKLGAISVSWSGDGKSNIKLAGFWEVYLRLDTTGFALRHVAHYMTAGNILLEGRIVTRHCYVSNKAALIRTVLFYLKHIIKQIYDNQVTQHRLSLGHSTMRTLGHSMIPERIPDITELRSYVSARCREVTRSKIDHLCGIHYKWNIGYVYGNWREFEHSKMITLQAEPFRYLADPFVISRDGRHYCFMEEMDYFNQRGSIAVYELTDNTGIRISTALAERFHLSFPYLFYFDGELYMCPECSESKSIRIYKCIEFPDLWKLENVIMNNISAADTMILMKNGRWWMFTNTDLAGTGDHCSELCIFYADNPLSECWMAHPDNPIILDASRARNAGYVVDGDTYFRCAQQQGFNIYGKRVMINKIVDLTESKYFESCCSVIEPPPNVGAVGTHHFHSNGAVTVFDFAVHSRIKDGAARTATRWAVQGDLPS